MTFRYRWMQFLCLLSVLLVVITLVVIQVRNTPAAHAATSQFRGVNWANPNDNFVTSNLVPVGLSTADSYSTTYAKATAILKGFQSLGANTVRLPFNAATTSGSWWSSYTAAWDAAAALGMKVVVAPWLQGGKVSDTTSFYQMWDTVINKYGGNSNFYFDIMNEPYAYSATDLTNFEAAWLARYPNLPRGQVIVPGTGDDTNLCAEGADSRLNGTLLSIHIYSEFGDSHTTEAAWVTDFENSLCGYASRAVVTEFGVPMNTGVNYDGPRDGTNDISYFYGITDTVRSLNMGSILWVGVKQATQTQGPGPCENASCALTTLTGSGTSLSLSLNNQSGLDRLQYGWNTTAPTPTPTPNSAGYALNAGGAAAGSFLADGYFSGGSTYSTTSTIDTSGVSNPAPQAVYQTERYGNFTYTLPGLTPGGQYTVRLHFAEIYWTSSGQRLFNVAINSQQVLSNFDIYATAGAANKAVVEQYTATADASGQIGIQFTGVKDNAKVSGIEVAASSGATPGPTPTSMPSSTPSPTQTVTGGQACSVHYAITNQWQGGFGASVTITNTGSTAISSWTLTWNFANGQTITQLWNGSYTQSGGTVAVTNVSYNGTIAPGSNTNFGFNGSWNGSNAAPASFTLNGKTCTTV